MQTLSREQIAAMEANLMEVLAPSVRPAKHSEPFAKRPEGMNRRAERKRRIRDKHAFLNS